MDQAVKAGFFYNFSFFVSIRQHIYTHVLSHSNVYFNMTIQMILQTKRPKSARYLPILEQ